MFADFFDFDFEKYFFNRCGIKDMHPYRAVEKDGKLVVILNTLGIDPKDIHIEPEVGDTYFKQYLVITGKTMNPITEEEHSINMHLGVRKEIGSIDWENKDGLTYLEVSFAEPIKPKIAISNKKLLAG
jgi:HSP20 family molecular chaperone IbpA